MNGQVATYAEIREDLQFISQGIKELSARMDAEGARRAAAQQEAMNEPAVSGVAQSQAKARRSARNQGQGHRRRGCSGILRRAEVPGQCRDHGRIRRRPGVRETERLFLLLDQEGRHVRGFVPKAGPDDLPPDAELGDLIRAWITAGTSR